MAPPGVVYPPASQLRNPMSTLAQAGGGSGNQGAQGLKTLATPRPAETVVSNGTVRDYIPPLLQLQLRLLLLAKRNLPRVVVTVYMCVRYDRKDDGVPF
jgi:hypothetical protein